MTALAIAARAEVVRIGGLRGAGAALLTLAIVGPAAVTVAVAALAEHVARIASTVQVTAVSTTNSAYWLLSLTPVACCAVAAYATAGSARREWDHFLIPNPAVGAGARWLVFGGFAAAATAVPTAVALAALPLAFPRVYGDVRLASATGVRMVLVGGITAFLLVGAAIGVALLLRHPIAAMVTVVGWAEIVEPGVALIPGAASAQRYMPFLNAVYASGQDLIFAPPWSPNGAVTYLVVLCLALLAVGLVGDGRLRPRPVRRMRSGPTNPA
ncbi:hypothetical protein [Tsukamurella pseudospumae]|uniref:ABC transporter permease n=1 Tax=Tsukamurella pseudospumae TaxID=239498 RepID=A0A137ZJY5_9ACTN|nr:hypothetical protein [Tsukamurella pseudospumae]KXO98495.1 hypothetical protein AXK61_02535 [Tsukamurella pseudospumae]